MATDDNNKGGVSWRQAMTTVGMALSLPWIIGAPAVLGWYIDKWAGTWPLWFLVGLALGLLSAGFSLYKLLKKFGQIK